MQQLIDEIRYITCTKDGHQEELSLLCMEDKCVGQLLICPICEQEQHKEHHVITLKQFLKDNCKEQVDLAGRVLDHLDIIDQNKQTLRQHITSIKQTFMDEMYQLENKSVEYFDKVSEKLLELSSIKNGKYIKKVLKIIEERSEVKCKRILSDIRKYSIISSNDILNHYSSITANKIAAVREIYKSTGIDKLLSKIVSQFETLQQFSLKPSYSWGPLKPQKIKINGMVASQTSSSSGGQRFALAEPRQGNNKDIEVAFKINKVKGWIGVGICLQNVIKQANYNFNYTQTYHGSYLISSNAYSWSHSQPQFNSYQNAFPFTEGDIIKITMNTQVKELVFENLKKGGKLKLDVIDPPYNDRYVPCVNLCTAGDEVELINDL